MNKEVFVERLGEFGYKICGLFSRNSCTVTLLEKLVLYLDDAYVANDIQDGDYIEFIVDRLDLFSST